MARLSDIVIDCSHPASLARFWAAALDGYAVAPYDEDEIERLRSLGITDPANHGWTQSTTYPAFPSHWQYSWQCNAGTATSGTPDSPGNPNSSAGVAQFVQPNNGGAGDFGSPSKNIGANSLYLWLSASLYSLTGDPAFFDGADNSNASVDEGGLYQEVQWLLNTSGLVHEYGSGALDTPGTTFLFNGEVDPLSSCEVNPTNTKEDQHMGTAVDALAAMYPAIEKASEQTGNIPADYTANSPAARARASSLT